MRHRLALHLPAVSLTSAVAICLGAVELRCRGWLPHGRTRGFFASLGPGGFECLCRPRGAAGHTLQPRQLQGANTSDVAGRSGRVPARLPRDEGARTGSTGRDRKKSSQAFEGFVSIATRRSYCTRTR